MRPLRRVERSHSPSAAAARKWPQWRPVVAPAVGVALSLIVGCQAPCRPASAVRSQEHRTSPCEGPLVLVSAAYTFDALSDCRVFTALDEELRPLATPVTARGWEQVGATDAFGVVLWTSAPPTQPGQWLCFVRSGSATKVLQAPDLSASIQLLPGCARAGRILDASTHPDTCVTVEYPDEMPFLPALEAVTTDRSGRFVLHGLPAPWDLNPRDTRNQRYRVIDSGLAGDTDNLVSACSSWLPVYLNPGARHLRGLVCGPNGDPLSCASVRPDLVSSRAERLPAAVTDSRGRFSFEAPLDFPVRIYHSSVAGGRVPLADVRYWEEIPLRLGPPASSAPQGVLSLHVRCGSGCPTHVFARIVSLGTGSVRRIALERREGGFEFADSFDEGKYCIRLEEPDYESAWGAPEHQDIGIEAGKTTPVLVTLIRRVAVSRIDGAAPEDATWFVSVEHPDSPHMEYADHQSQIHLISDPRIRGLFIDSSRATRVVAARDGIVATGVVESDGESLVARLSGYAPRTLNVSGGGAPWRTVVSLDGCPIAFVGTGDRGALTSVGAVGTHFALLDTADVEAAGRARVCVVDCGGVGATDFTAHTIDVSGMREVESVCAASEVGGVLWPANRKSDFEWSSIGFQEGVRVTVVRSGLPPLRRVLCGGAPYHLSDGESELRVQLLGPDGRRCGGKIAVDGYAIEVPEYGRVVPRLDAGEHRVTSLARGSLPRTLSVRLGPQESRFLVLDVPELMRRR